MSLRLKAHLRRSDFCLNVDCELPTDGVTALFGRSGCGKTTLLRIVAGLEKVKGTKLKFNQQQWQTEKVFLPLHKRRLGLVFQESSLMPHLSVKGNLLYGYQRTSPGLRRIDLDQVVEMLGIGNLLSRRVDKLSGGQSQRVALGRALLTSPQLLLLDEPLAALDSQTKSEIMPFLSRLASESGVPMLLVTHSAQEVQRLADRVVFMQAGEISSIEEIQEATSRLDSPLFQENGPSVILLGRIGSQDEFGRRLFHAGNDRICLPQSIEHRHGNKQRLRIAARDVSLAVGSIGQLSIQNRLHAQVKDISSYKGQDLVSLRLNDGQIILAEITRQATVSLALKKDMVVTALIKSVALME